MHVLLIAEQKAEFRLIKHLLDGIQGESHQLTWCQADLKSLASTDVNQFQVLIWGKVQNQNVSKMILAELKRQQSLAPVIIITDEVPKKGDIEAIERGHSDILLRSCLSSRVLSRGLHFVSNTTTLPVKEADTTDPLTGLSNRQQFREYLKASLSKAVAIDSVGLLLVDIDQFKKVNDSYGERAGDQLIKEIVNRIEGCLSNHQMLSRIGGNEFAVVFQNSIGLE